MIPRVLTHELDAKLCFSPAVVLLGPRQVGKTTLALERADNQGGVYVDLESPRDLAKVSDIEGFCDLHKEDLLILDEIHRLPELFAPLRGIIDKQKREGFSSGQFLLLGSASLDLIRQTGETLAGRVTYLELKGLDIREVGFENVSLLWNRGGFPDSFLALDDDCSIGWRENFIRTYLERDIPQFGPRIPAETLRRFWTMLAHNQGQTFNASVLGRSLGVSSVTVSRYLDLMVDLLLVRRLLPWRSNFGKRMTKAPKTYVRDTGVCHALLGIKNLDALLGHPVCGRSWEGFVMENLTGVLPSLSQMGYYRSSGGAEVDLVIEFGSHGPWTIEIKRTVSSVSKGFHFACEDIQPSRKFVVHAGQDSFPLAKDIEAVSLPDLLERVVQAS